MFLYNLWQLLGSNHLQTVFTGKSWETHALSWETWKLGPRRSQTSHRRMSPRLWISKTRVAAVVFWSEFKYQRERLQGLIGWDFCLIPYSLWTQLEQTAMLSDIIVYHYRAVLAGILVSVCPGVKVKMSWVLVFKLQTLKCDPWAYGRTVTPPFVVRGFEYNCVNDGGWKYRLRACLEQRVLSLYTAVTQQAERIALQQCVWQVVGSGAPCCEVRGGRENEPLIEINTSDRRYRRAEWIDYLTSPTNGLILKRQCKPMLVR